MINVKDIDDVEVLELMKQNGKGDTLVIDSRIKEIMEGDYGDGQVKTKDYILYGAVVIAVIALSYGGYKLVKYGGNKLINFIKSKRKDKQESVQEVEQTEE